MELTEAIFPDGQPPIDGYGPGFFRIGGDVFAGPTLITPRAVTQWAGLGDWDAIVDAWPSFDVLFIGMGDAVAPLSKKDAALLRDAGIAFETMASPSAARTYNVLLSEQRRIAAALVPI
ncbi:MAG: Mth938-like domain-containing protein [Pseudomonadota bacterium]